MENNEQNGAVERIIPNCLAGNDIQGMYYCHAHYI